MLHAEACFTDAVIAREAALVADPQTVADDMSTNRVELMANHLFRLLPCFWPRPNLSLPLMTGHHVF
jgi:hypothetical protein